MGKRHLSITNKKKNVFGMGVDLRLKVQNILFTVHITLAIWILWKKEEIGKGGDIYHVVK